MKLLNLITLTFTLYSLSGCGGAEEPFTKETFPVKGKITVDGTPPDSPIQIMCHPQGQIDTTHPTISKSETTDGGNFEISTYTSGDGMPEGEYALTFVWQKFNTFSRGFQGPDKLKKRYSDPKKSEITFSVKPGEPVDLGVIELTTK
jgi:hypothetical protein